jgi:hypothetical protein
VVRRVERRPADERPSRDERAGDGVDRRDLQRLVRSEIRQQRRQPLGEHRLADTGRSLQVHVMTARGSDLDRPPRGRLTHHVSEIRGVVDDVVGLDVVRGRWWWSLVAQPRTDLGQRRNSDDLGLRDEPGLAVVGRRHDEPSTAGAIGADHRWQHAVDRLDGAGE